MTEHDLFAAIGQAEDPFLLEIEQVPTRRLPRCFGLIAAMLALVLTACAAPAVIRSFDKLLGGQRAQDGDGYHVIKYTSNREILDSYFVPTGVDLEVEVAPDAPAEIESYFLPVKLLEYCQVESCTDTEEEFSLSLSMQVPRYGRAYGISYRQCVLPKDGNVHIEWVLDALDWEQSFQVYGDMTVLEFSGSGRYEDADGSTLLYEGNHVAKIYTKQLFWSDGNYLYCLKLPITYNLPITAVEEIVTSLTAVEDITEYLPAGE